MKLPPKDPKRYPTCAIVLRSRLSIIGVPTQSNASGKRDKGKDGIKDGGKSGHHESHDTLGQREKRIRPPTKKKGGKVKLLFTTQKCGRANKRGRNGGNR